MVRQRRRAGRLREEVGERPPLGLDQVVRPELELFDDDELEQECAADVADVLHGRDEPAAQVCAPAGRRAVDGAGRTGGAGLGALGFDQAERLQAFEGAVDELAGQVPDVADPGAGAELGGYVVAMAGLLDQDAEDGPLVERERRAAFHTPRLPRPTRDGCDC